MNQNNKHMIKRSNELVEGQYDFTELEKKAFLLAISKINPDDDEFQEWYEFSVKEFIAYTGIRRNSIYKDLENATKGILKKIVTIIRGDVKIQVGLFTKVVYDKGNVKVRIDHDLKPHLLKMKEYTKTYLEDFMKVKGIYALELYELLKRHQFKAQKTFEVTIDFLRFKLSIKDNEYTRFYDFEKRVLKPAQKEIKKNSDIEFTYEKIKQGRKVVGFKFTIIPKENKAQNTGLYSESEVWEIKSNSVLGKLNFSDNQVIELYEIAVNKTKDKNINPYQYINMNYEKIKEKNVKNLYSYFKKALENDYADVIYIANILNAL
ncbi:MAG: replication initiation protein [Thermosipho sp. (in: Bacteria)]|nr:replication initiation protein [Thermosipho sp. (in: thermotogales)]